jgi:repressor LexA
MSETLLTGKRREILDFIAAQVRERGYPPSVREIGLAVGLASTSTVQASRRGHCRRHERPRLRERPGAAAPPRRLHRQGQPLHAESPR